MKKQPPKTEHQDPDKKVALAIAQHILALNKTSTPGLPPDVEHEIEELGLQRCKYLISLTAHQTEKTEEIKSIRTARKIFLIISGVLSVGVIVALYISLIWPDWFGNKLSENAHVVFISGSFIAAFGLIAIILKGLFKIESSDSGVAEILKALGEAVTSHKE